VRLAGDVAAEAWLRDLFERRQSVTELGAALLAPGRGVLARPRGRLVCTCLNVSEREVADFVSSAPAGEPDLLDRLQARLRCGTNCGSCLPELKRLVAAQNRAAA
jgi:assimilatory nitrate reductase catalytic subunit